MGKTMGLILIGLGAAGIVLTAVLMTVYLGEASLSAGAATLGFTLGALLSLLPLGAGIYMFRQGTREAAVAADIARQRRLLDMVKTRGQVALEDIILELRSTRDEVSAMLYDLVGKGLFSGYVVWDEGMLYSEQAAELRQISNCRNCGGELELGGKGVIRCPYCGTDYFLD